MPVVAAIAGVFVIAVVVKLGTAAGAEVALLYRMMALAVLASVVILVIYLYHRRKQTALIMAKYDAHADTLKMRKVSLIGRKDARVCAECSALVVDYWTLRDHVNWHEQLAELIAGEKLEPAAPPWTAVTEPVTAPEAVTEHEQAPQIEEEEPRYERFRELFNAKITR